MPTIRIIATAICVLTSAPTQSSDTQEGFIFNFESYLEALDEPNLRERCSEAINAYRLIANPAFTDAWAVRISDHDGIATVFFSKASIQEEPTTSSRVVVDSVLTELNELLAESKFLQLPANSEKWIPDDTIATIETCIDGRYHAIQRQFWHDETRNLVGFFGGLRDKPSDPQ